MTAAEGATAYGTPEGHMIRIHPRAVGISAGITSSYIRGMRYPPIGG